MTQFHTAISLFSGVMGFDFGLESTGRFGILAAVERDPACCAAIRANHAAGRIGGRGFRLYEAAVEALDPEGVMADLGLRPGQLDLLCGGPPCGPYSHAGRRRGVRDLHGLAAWHFLWFLRALRPRTFVLENVPGLLSARLSRTGAKGTVIEELLAEVPTAYRVDVVVANAADYGAAQTRRRVFVVGNRLGRPMRLPPPTHGPRGSRLPPYRTLREALAGLGGPEPFGARYTARRRAVLARVPPGGNWRALPEDVAQAAMGRAYFRSGGRPGFFRRLSWDEPAPTITTDAAAVMVCRCHPDETRPLTVAESARLQGFPDNWTFCGSRTDRYRQVGNAVPVPLGDAIGRTMADLLGRAGADPLPSREGRGVMISGPPSTRQTEPTARSYDRNAVCGG